MISVHTGASRRMPSRSKGLCMPPTYFAKDKIQACSEDHVSKSGTTKSKIKAMWVSLEQGSPLVYLEATPRVKTKQKSKSPLPCTHSLTHFPFPTKHTIFSFPGLASMSCARFPPLTQKNYVNMSRSRAQI